MKINYSMKLISPANTASLGNIDKIIDIGVKIDSKGNPIIFGKQIKGILKNTAISFRNALNLGDQKVICTLSSTQLNYQHFFL